jgi:hypothetical protein
LRRLILLLPLIAAGCADDPMRRIPATDRALLEAEARLGGPSGQPGGRTSVEEILARARGDNPGDTQGATASDTTLVLRFTGEAVQPDAGQRALLSGFAARNRAGRIVVTGGRGDPTMLGERRAVAVARALEGQAASIELRFASGAPADAVQIASAPGTPLAPAGGR